MRTIFNFIFFFVVVYTHNPCRVILLLFNCEVSIDFFFVSSVFVLCSFVLRSGFSVYLIVIYVSKISDYFVLSSLIIHSLIFCMSINLLRFQLFNACNSGKDLSVKYKNCDRSKIECPATYRHMPTINRHTN